MFLVGILSWWYSKGWSRRFNIAKNNLESSADLFSISLLIKTLFAPFRQISVGTSGTSIRQKLQAFFDKLLSRCIGAIVRSFMIILGLIVMACQALFYSFIVIFWLVIPILPLVGIILMFIGWVPAWKI